MTNPTLDAIHPDSLARVSGGATTSGYAKVAKAMRVVFPYDSAKLTPAGHRRLR